MTITQGTQFQADANGFFANIVELTSTTAIVFYSTAGSDIVAAKHLTLSGSTITAGSQLVVDNTALASFGRNIRSVRLTDTSALIAYSFNGNTHKARVITVSGTTLTAHSVINLTDATNIWANSLDFLTSTAVIYVYNDSGGTGKARILTISGTTVTENAAFTYDADCFNSAVAALSTTKAAVVFCDNSNSDALTGEILDISGTTITGNADQTLSAVKADEPINYRIGVGALDSTHIIIQWYDGITNRLLAVAASISGTTITAGTTIVIIDSGSVPQDNMIAALSSTRALGVAGPSVIEYAISGVTVTELERVTIGTASGTDDSWLAVLGSSSSIAAWDESIETIPIFVSPAATLTLSDVLKPASIDASGTFIYLALLNNGTPILSKFSTDLNADGSTVFDPGAGDQIGVQCGKFDDQIIWIAGTFDGLNTVEKSDDGGASFVVKDGGIFDFAAFAFEVGPDSDSRVICNDGDADIIETIDSGENWTIRGLANNKEVAAMARLGENVQEIVLGNLADVTDNINYSVNSGANTEDFQTGVFPSENVTGVIVN